MFDQSNLLKKLVAKNRYHYWSIFWRSDASSLYKYSSLEEESIVKRKKEESLLLSPTLLKN